MTENKERAASFFIQVIPYERNKVVFEPNGMHSDQNTKHTIYVFKKGVDEFTLLNQCQLPAKPSLKALELISTRFQVPKVTKTERGIGKVGIFQRQHLIKWGVYCLVFDNENDAKSHRRAGRKHELRHRITQDREDSSVSTEVELFTRVDRDGGQNNHNTLHTLCDPDSKPIAPPTTPSHTDSSRHMDSSPYPQSHTSTHTQSSNSVRSRRKQGSRPEYHYGAMEPTLPVGFQRNSTSPIHVASPDVQESKSPPPPPQQGGLKSSSSSSSSSSRSSSPSVPSLAPTADTHHSHHSWEGPSPSNDSESSNYVTPKLGLSPTGAHVLSPPPPPAPEDDSKLLGTQGGIHITPPGSPNLSLVRGHPSIINLGSPPIPIVYGTASPPPQPMVGTHTTSGSVLSNHSHPTTGSSHSSSPSLQYMHSGTAEGGRLGPAAAGAGGSQSHLRPPQLSPHTVTLSEQPHLYNHMQHQLTEPDDVAQPYQSVQSPPPQVQPPTTAGYGIIGSLSPPPPAATPGDPVGAAYTVNPNDNTASNRSSSPSTSSASASTMLSSSASAPSLAPGPVVAYTSKIRHPPVRTTSSHTAPQFPSPTASGNTREGHPSSTFQQGESGSDRSVESIRSQPPQQQQPASFSPQHTQAALPSTQSPQHYHTHKPQPLSPMPSESGTPPYTPPQQPEPAQPAVSHPYGQVYQQPHIPTNAEIQQQQQPQPQQPQQPPPQQQRPQQQQPTTVTAYPSASATVEGGSNNGTEVGTTSSQPQQRKQQPQHDEQGATMSSRPQPTLTTGDPAPPLPVGTQRDNDVEGSYSSKPSKFDRTLFAPFLVPGDASRLYSSVSSQTDINLEDIEPKVIERIVEVEKHTGGEETSVIRPATTDVGTSPDEELGNLSVSLLPQPPTPQKSSEVQTEDRSPTLVNMGTDPEESFLATNNGTPPGRGGFDATPPSPTGSSRYASSPSLHRGQSRIPQSPSMASSPALLPRGSAGSLPSSQKNLTHMEDYCGHYSEFVVDCAPSTTSGPRTDGKSKAGMYGSWACVQCGNRSTKRSGYICSICKKDGKSVKLCPNCFLFRPPKSQPGSPEQQDQNGKDREIDPLAKICYSSGITLDALQEHLTAYEHAANKDGNGAGFPDETSSNKSGQTAVRSAIGSFKPPTGSKSPRRIVQNRDNMDTQIPMLKQNPDLFWQVLKEGQMGLAGNTAGKSFQGGFSSGSTTPRSVRGITPNMSFSFGERVASQRKPNIQAAASHAVLPIPTIKD